MSAYSCRMFVDMGRRARRVAAPLALVLVASLVVSLPGPAWAGDPPLPPGARSSAPVQRTRPVVPGAPSSASSQRDRSVTARPRSTAAVGDEVVHPVVPPQARVVAPQVLGPVRESLDGIWHTGFDPAVSSEMVSART